MNCAAIFCGKADPNPPIPNPFPQACHAEGKGIKVSPSERSELGERFRVGGTSGVICLNSASSLHKNAPPDPHHNPPLTSLHLSAALLD